MKIKEYNIKTSKKIGKLNLACVSDLHARRFKNVIEALKIISPDIILLAGDILEVSNEYMQKRNQNALEFLCQAAEIAPVYYCFGNHEIYYSHAHKLQNRISDPEILAKNLDIINSHKIHLINNAFEHIELDNGIKFYVGGLVCGEDTDPSLNKTEPDLMFLNEFDKLEGFKILLCHYPHYYEKYIKNTGFDIVFAGHAHGGQWRIFGHGVYSPHQGLFPKLTSGIVDGKMIISRGAVNNSRPIPRFFNPTEILKVNISQY